MVRVPFFFCYYKRWSAIATTNSPIFYCFGRACFWLWLSRISCILCLSLMLYKNLIPGSWLHTNVRTHTNNWTITIGILSVDLFLVASSLNLGCWSQALPLTLTILRFTGHETNNYIFTLLKNRSRTKCQKHYDSPFCKSECFDQITRVLRTNEFSTEASFWKLFCHVQRLSKTFSIL